jgi:hypothetical protein
MATKKKTRKKSTKSKRTAPKKKTLVKTAKRPKKVARKKLAPKKSAPKKAEKKTPGKKKPSGEKQARKTSGRTGSLSFSAQGPGSRLGAQSGDLQGLSRDEVANSESVDELVEEGNAFEADVVAGVESADDADEKEVHTHEVPEDDVPEEYLDKD